ncbi:MAG TPA: adenylate/guanylate cyclase domain-containing protein, partial [Candidatus Limnocylindrales bacterium]|nr:adenylate/guanylate cyclase domain-containing protein [Candidatus Limnocylindrales bacterium]
MRFRKRTLAIAALVVTLIAPVWGATYALLGILPAAIIPLAYSIVSMLAIARFARTKRAEEFRTIELGLVLVLPFAEQLALGGFVNGSAVMVWSFAAVLGALLFLPGLGPVRWFATYLALAVATVLLDPLVAPSARPLPEPVRIAFVVLNVGGVSATTFLLLLYFVRQREEALALSDRLLLDVLPAPIAARLKRAPGVIADAYEEATVLFADIVDFTPFAERTSPDAVVALLDRAFRAFDELTERHGLQKIKTIGDAYLVVGGLPERRPDHAEAIAEMALAMQPALEAA